MKNLGFLFFFILTISCGFLKDKKETYNNFTIGVMADCQYCDCPDKGIRYYRSSPKRMESAIEEFNKHDLAYTIHLGDFIDHKFSSFDTLIPIWDKLKSKSYHVLGNHDFAVNDSLKTKVFDKLNLKKRYYSFEKNNWKFIVLDGNDLSFHGSLSTEKKNEAATLFEKKKNKNYAKKYNGGLSKSQLEWVEEELKLATKNKQHVGFFDHFPVNPIESHNLWNTDEFLGLIKKYNCVKVFMNGHNHAGSYMEENGVHFITYKGMVDTENTTSYALTKFTKDSIFIKGFGREENRKLKIKQD